MGHLHGILNARADLPVSEVYVYITATLKVMMPFSFLLLFVKYKYGSVYIDAREGGVKEGEEHKYYLKQ